MVVYWILFGLAALMVLVNRASSGDAQRKQTKFSLPLLAFGLLYVAIGGLRYETGGDWLTYSWMYTQISYSSFVNAINYTDPLYGLLNWISAQLGTGIYLVNSVVCTILVIGVTRAARLTSDPWLAILVAVPYILIVIGLGYVRQAAAIGLQLMALSSLEESRRSSSVGYLTLAAGFHSTAIFMFPLFLLSITRRFSFYTFAIICMSALAYLSLFAPRLDTFRMGYLDSGYQSEGTLVRLLMSALPALLLLVRWKNFELQGQSRKIWLGVAICAIGFLPAYFFSPSSTAIDRVGLYFSIIQILVFGELLNLLGLKKKDNLYIRVLAIALATAVQFVWLFYSIHLKYWVPYKSILDAV